MGYNSVNLNMFFYFESADDHARGLSTFTVMAGFGGSLGYIIGAIDWGASFSNNSFNEHVQIVFAMITVAFIASVMLTVTSFPEVPLNQLESQSVTANDNSSTTPGGQEAQKVIIINIIKLRKP